MITELLITGYDECGASLFALNLTAEEAKVMRPDIDDGDESIVGDFWEKATDAFAVIRDLMNDILDTRTSASS
jgi:hypothetical protein